MQGVEIETEWNLKIYTFPLHDRVSKVEIETEWNLKVEDSTGIKEAPYVEIETEWNLKYAVLQAIKKETPGRDRNRVEFKAKIKQSI